VVTVPPELMPEPGPSGEELVPVLQRHGLKVSLRQGSGRQRQQGDSFLNEATAAGADLLIKGAYTQNRIRQMMFGGATRQIIMEAKIPVVLAR
jgi:nucleotide-binding universal stress UspA family protein